MLTPRRGLIVMPHYADLIVRGLKTWEMRTTGSSIQEPVAIIASGTKTIVGIAAMDGSLPPLTRAAMSANEIKHRIAPSDQKSAFDGGWIHPWVMRAALKLATPLAFPQKNGAVIWTRLDDVTIARLARAIAASTRIAA